MDHPQVAARAARPWWACALVPAYLGTGYLALMAVATAMQPGLTFGWYLYLLFPVLGWFIPAALVAWIVLAVTRRSPWASPEIDALTATAIGLAVSLVIGIPLLLATATRV